MQGALDVAVVDRVSLTITPGEERKARTVVGPGAVVSREKRAGDAADELEHGARGGVDEGLQEVGARVPGDEGIAGNGRLE